MKIKKGDTVQIIKGKDRLKKDSKGDKTTKGNQGKVVRVVVGENKIVVEGLNLHFKHMRPRKQGEKGQRVQLAGLLTVANVMLVCPKCKQLTRVGYRLLESDKKGSKKVRICKKCKEVID